MNGTTLWNVFFVTDDKVETVTVAADNEEDAVGIAEALMTDETGRDYSRIGGTAEEA